MPLWNNDCRFIGNITHPPFFRRVGASELPFLRFYLAVDGEGKDGPAYVRVVAYGSLALYAFPYLDVGSKLLVQAHYRQRQRRDKDELVHEFVAEQIVFLDKINWERGEAVTKRFLEEHATLAGNGGKR